MVEQKLFIRIVHLDVHLHPVQYLRLNTCQILLQNVSTILSYFIIAFHILHFIFQYITVFKKCKRDLVF